MSLLSSHVLVALLFLTGSWVLCAVSGASLDVKDGQWQCPTRAAPFSSQLTQRPQVYLVLLRITKSFRPVSWFSTHTSIFQKMLFFFLLNYSMLDYDTENLNSEEIYSSLRGVTEAIEKFSFRSQEDLNEPIKRDGKKDCDIVSVLGQGTTVSVEWQWT